MHDFSWDPHQYGMYADYRSRPFRDLVGRIRATDPRQVVDLGCGPGAMTRSLLQRWPRAEVLGLDSSPDMVTAARQSLGPDGSEWLESGPGSVRFEEYDAAHWTPGPEVDVVISNAMLQWVPDHRELMAGWLEALRPGAWFAVQVPGNFAAPSHAQIAELSRDPRFSEVLEGVLRRESVYTLEEYLQTLVHAGLEPDVWETTYHQTLTGEDPVYTWVRGAALRPSLQRLERADAERGTTLLEEYTEEYQQRMREAYATVTTPGGRVLTDYPFRRIFVVGHKPEPS